MIQEKSVLAIIPARGGSKGLLDKNIRPLGGKPLLAWTIEAAHGSTRIDRTILTSDDAAVIEVARQWQCEAPFVRPAELATDQSPVADAILHALDAIDGTYDYLMLLQPTSPLRTTEDIDECLERCIRARAPACLTVTRQEKSPAWMFHIDQADRLTPLDGWDGATAQRQDLPSVWALNGAVFVAATPWFRRHRVFLTAETVAHPMPPERSIDIDSAFDFAVAETLVGGLAGGGGSG